MSRVYSINLRERVVAAMPSGASARAAASQFGVSVASAVRWSQRQRRTGGAAPGNMARHVSRRTAISASFSGFPDCPQLPSKLRAGARITPPVAFRVRRRTPPGWVTEPSEGRSRSVLSSSTQPAKIARGACVPPQTQHTPAARHPQRRLEMSLFYHEPSALLGSGLTTATR
jgi:hypothetical protein